MRIALGNVNGGQVTAGFASSLWWTASEHPDWEYIAGAPSPYLPENRNAVVATFLDLDVDRLLFVDSDVTWTPADVLALARRDLDAVSGLYFSPLGPVGGTANPIAWDADGEPVGWRDGDLVEVAVVGCGFLMLSRRVLLELSAVHDGRPFRTEQSADCDPRRFRGEDVILCERIRALGYAVHVDCGVVVSHRKGVEFRPEVELFEEHVRMEVRA